MTDLHAAQHSSAQPSYGTPRPIVELARCVLGGDANLGSRAWRRSIGLDPFSSHAWNEAIEALRILTEQDDAFSCAWFDGAPTAREILYIAENQWQHDHRPRVSCTALVNPPGLDRGAGVKRAWRLVEWHHRTGWLGGGVLWVAFNIGQLQQLQNSGAPRSPLHRDFLVCVPRKRIAYETSPGVVGAQPAHASALVLLPAHGAAGDLQRATFTGLAGELGEVR